MPLNDIRGQESAVDILKKNLSESKIAPAYLFLGPEGTGKHSAAIEFARLINCGCGSDDNCGTCVSCLKIEKGVHPDVFVISREDTGKGISIERIRGLSARLSLKPLEARYKVAVIDARDLNEQASNALLKLLEEPDSDTVFILTAVSRNALADTVISRCRVLRFNPLKKADVVEILKKDFGVSDEEAGFLSGLSGLNIKKALLFKQEGALLRKNAIIDEFGKLASSYGLSGSGVTENTKDAQREAMEVLLCFYRDALIYKYTRDKALIMNADRQEAVSKLADSSDTSDIQTAIRYIEETKRALASNANPKLAIRLLKERLAG